MGGGNAQKSATARARNEAKKAKAGKGSQLAVNQAAQNVICQVDNNTKLASGLAVIFVLEVQLLYYRLSKAVINSRCCILA